MKDLEIRYFELLNKNKVSDKKIDESFYEKWNEAITYIEATKQFSTDEQFKFSKDKIDELNEQIKEVKSLHATVELFGKIIENEFNSFRKKSGKDLLAPISYKLFPTFGLNAMALKYPEGYLVVIENGLDKFLLTYFGILCRYDEFQKNLLNGNIISDTLSRSEIIEELTKLFVLYRKSKEVPEYMLLNYMVTSSDGMLQELYGMLYRETLLYLIAHEISHIHLSHHESDASLKFVLNDAGLYPNFSRDLELQADYHAFKILFNSERTLVPGHTWSSLYGQNKGMYDINIKCFYSGITMFFHIGIFYRKSLDLKESIRLGEEYITKYDFELHPSDSQRQLQFMETLQEMKEDILLYAGVNGILKDIGNNLIPSIARSI